MPNRLKNIFVFLITILLAAGVYIWFYPLNKGKVAVTAGTSDYSITVEEETIECLQDPCLITLKAGAHNLKAQKDNYYPETINVYIQRGKTDEISIGFQKIPNLIVSQIIPQEIKPLKDLPNELKDSPILAPAWDQTEEKLVFLDLSDNKLKIWEENKDLKIITMLKNINEGLDLYWSPDQAYLLGNVEEDIYFIDTASASRKKYILSFSPQNIIWSLENDYLLANDEKDELYKINFAEQSIESLQITLNLNNAVWAGKDNLIFFSYNEEENKTTIESYNPNTQEKVEILIKYNFPINKISSDANNIVYFYNSEQETWYHLDY